MLCSIEFDAQTNSNSSFFPESSIIKPKLIKRKSNSIEQLKLMSTVIRPKKAGARNNKSNFLIGI